MGNSAQTPKQFKTNPLIGALGYLNLWPAQRIVLNRRGAPPQQQPPQPSADGIEIAENLRKSILKLYGQFLSADGGAVDYTGLGDSDEFQEYLSLAERLDSVNPTAMGDGERTAFFINIYNSLLVNAIVALGPPADLLSRLRLYARASYSIGGLEYSLNDIENGVLRSNRPGPSPFARAPFRDGDPRRGAAVGAVDPRIHFALNCGARGCPAVRFYRSESLPQSLDAAARAFCRAVDVDEPAREVTLSQIFQWYAADFVPTPQPAGPAAGGGGGGGVATDSDYPVLRWVMDYLDEPARAALGRLLESAGAGGGPIRVKYAEYDWALNSK